MQRSGKRVFGWVGSKVAFTVETKMQIRSEVCRSVTRAWFTALGVLCILGLSVPFVGHACHGIQYVKLAASAVSTVLHLMGVAFLESRYGKVSGEGFILRATQGCPP